MMTVISILLLTIILLLCFIIYCINYISNALEAACEYFIQLNKEELDKIEALMKENLTQTEK